MSRNITFKIDKNDYGFLFFDLKDKTVNILNRDMLEELSIILDELSNNNKIKALVITSKKAKNFIAGADINEIYKLKNYDDVLNKVKQGQAIIHKISSLTFPTISVINGSCLGGGLELALASNFRLAFASSDVKIGLPEVKLGIFPGFGGTQRLPRLISLQDALKLILTGKTIGYSKAYRLGIIDKVISPNKSEQEIIEFVNHIIKNSSRDIIKKRKKNKKLLDKFSISRRLIFKIARANIGELNAKHYPSLMNATDAVEMGYQLDNINSALGIEAEKFAEIAYQDTAKNLIQLFLTSQELKNENWQYAIKNFSSNSKSLSKKSDKTSLADNVNSSNKYFNYNFRIREQAGISGINSAVILGGGVMGSGIAWLLSKHNIKVRIKDVANENITNAYKQINANYKFLVKKRKLENYQANLYQHNISYTTDFKGIKHQSLIIEAVFENLKEKCKILNQIEEQVKIDTIIASNTSSLSVNEIAKSLKRPENFIGLHFFNPVARMPLVEVIPSKYTNPQIRARMIDFARGLNKTVVVVKDVAGFLVNRILMSYMNEAFKMFAEGISFVHIDEEAVEFGMPMGPFRLADEIGIDICANVATSFDQAYNSDKKNKDKILAMLQEFAANKSALGKKTKKGFYLYERNYSKSIDKLKANDDMIAKNNAHKLITDDEIKHRLFLNILNEASRCLEEGVISSAKYLDFALVIGTGFPPFRGGICRFADKFGISRAVDILDGFAEKHGQHFKPAKILSQMAKNDQCFYQL